jgi:L-fucose mutarotase
MLKGIPPLLSPRLLAVLMEMGHGDEIVLADGNFPAASNAQRLVRADGLDIPPLLEAILKFCPLDTYVPKPVALMAVVPGDDVKPVIWDVYRDIVAAAAADRAAANRNGAKAPEDLLEFLEREEFYERARGAYAVVATSERALYANVLLKKGVVV